MRKEQEMFDLILGVANSDDRIRAVSMEGSRANPNIPKDKHQDYDITFYVKDIEPFFNKPEWVEEKFGKYLIMQMPEAMRNPCGDGYFNYMMIYPDGVRLDLNFVFDVYEDDGEPSVTLLDKDNGNSFRPVMPTPSDKIYHIKPPSPLFYYSCCNEFWWCLNNAAKGIARDELPYVIYMLNIVRGELHDMINWYIGTQHGFDLSTGKENKYIKKYLSKEQYKQYTEIYSGSDYGDVWKSIYVMCDLFRELALSVAESFDFTYRQNEEDGIRTYMKMIK